MRTENKRMKKRELERETSPARPNQPAYCHFTQPARWPNLASRAPAPTGRPRATASYHIRAPAPLTSVWAPFVSTILNQTVTNSIIRGGRCKQNRRATSLNRVPHGWVSVVHIKPGIVDHWTTSSSPYAISSKQIEPRAEIEEEIATARTRGISPSPGPQSTGWADLRGTLMMPTLHRAGLRSICEESHSIDWAEPPCRSAPWNLASIVIRNASAGLSASLRSLGGGRGRTQVDCDKNTGKFLVVVGKSPWDRFSSWAAWSSP
jgi:hypothetical protein